MKFDIHIDASVVAIITMLTQAGDDGMDHPNTYKNMQLNKVERNYSTTKREELGMVFALLKYRHDLLANPFVFYTNHQALK